MSLDAATATIKGWMPAEGSFLSTYGLLFITIALVGSFYISSYVCISNFVGSMSRWVDVNPQIATIWGYTLPAAAALGLAALIYFRNDRSGIMYFIFAMTCIAFSFSFSALAISTVTK
jgi:hypothetical protein